MHNVDFMMKEKKLLNWALGLVSLPLLIIFLYGMYANVNRYFRYDEAYFTPQYRSKYDVPAKLTIALEKALQEGDEELYAELLGLKRAPDPFQPKPNIYFSILLDVDEADYFHYLFFDFDTYHRSTYYVKEVKGRWIVVPVGLYFYWDNHQWWDFMMPITITWWSLLTVAGIGFVLYQKAAKYRRKTYDR